MDAFLWALIESEREAEEAFAGIPSEALGPVGVVEDADGARIEVYVDGSYVAKGRGGELL